MFLNVKNNAESTLASGISDSDLSLTVATGEGALFPATNFHITLEDEIVLCTSRTGDVFTIVRAQEGTVAAAHLTGVEVDLNVTAQIITELGDEITRISTHNNLTGLQGGTAAEYYHLTSARHTVLGAYTERAITVPTGGIFNIDIGSAAGDDFIVDTNKLVVEGDSGNVGIGTTSPGAKLDVSGSFQTTSGLTWAIGGMIGESVGQHLIGGYDTTNSIGYLRSANNGTTFTDLRLAGSTISLWYGAGLLTQGLTLSNTGNVGIGTTTPTAVLHLKAGTATANTAPIKLTQASAVVLTTPEAGTIECNDGDLLYYTIKTGTARKTIAFIDSAQTWTGVQTMTSPAITTSITTSTASFTAFAGATTLLTIGGTGASASLFAPSTLDTTSSTTGAIRTSGGISAAKAGNIGTTLTIGTSIELGHASDTTLSRSAAGVLAVENVVIPSISSTNTLTNKRITPRILSATSYTTNTGTSINGDTLDMFIVTAQAGALLFNNPTGTPTDGQKLIISVASSTTTARALTWGNAYGATTVSLPTTTAATTVTLTIGFIWSASKSLWQCVAVA